jgi:hypothetical protein
MLRALPGYEQALWPTRGGGTPEPAVAGAAGGESAGMDARWVGSLCWSPVR